jgi:outer membrane immunogenic protein
MSMKFIARIVAATAFVAAASSASAADLRPAYKGPAPVVIAAYNWSGFYVGAHAGYGWGGLEFDFVGTSGLGRNIDGFFGGGQVGWNWQAAGSPWVFGLEADISFGNIEDSVTSAAISFTTEARMFGTARARLGYAVDRTLWYVTGGLAWIDNEMTIALPGFGTFNSSNTHVGWTAGGGVEWAFADAWSAKAEYLYLDTGSENYFTNIAGPGLTFSPFIHTVRLGLNYRFGGGKGPVVAKY